MTLTSSVSPRTEAVQDGRQRGNVALQLHALEMKTGSVEKQRTFAKRNVSERFDESGCCPL